MQTDAISAQAYDQVVQPSSASVVVFTTIDGVLRCGATGSFAEARAALDLLIARGIPVVLTSDGDAAAVSRVQRELGLGREPLICRGGESLYIPRGYFPELDGLAAGDDDWEIFEMGGRDVARAVRLLTSFYGFRGDDVLTIGFACDWADRALLSAVTVPVVVRQDADQSRLLRRLPEAFFTTGLGPLGWSEAVLGSAGA